MTGTEVGDLKYEGYFGEAVINKLSKVKGLRYSFNEQLFEDQHLKIKPHEPVPFCYYAHILDLHRDIEKTIDQLFHCQMMNLSDDGYVHMCLVMANAGDNKKIL
eukprot:gene11931-13900_t